MAIETLTYAELGARLAWRDKAFYIEGLRAPFVYWSGRQVFNLKTGVRSP